MLQQGYLLTVLSFSQVPAISRYACSSVVLVYNTYNIVYIFVVAWNMVEKEAEENYDSRD